MVLMIASIIIVSISSVILLEVLIGGLKVDLGMQMNLVLLEKNLFIRSMEQHI